MPRKPVSYSQPDLGKALRFLRTHRRMTQHDVSAGTAADGGKPIDVTYLSHLEREGKKMITPTQATLDKVLHALDVDEATLAQVINGRPWESREQERATNSYITLSDVNDAAPSLDNTSKALYLEQLDNTSQRLRSTDEPELLHRSRRMRERSMSVQYRQLADTPLASVESTQPVIQTDPALAEIIAGWNGLSASARATLLGVFRNSK